jgi:hypothetical protein
MAPHAINDDFVDRKIGLADIKSKVIVDHVELDVKPAPPVADDFMYDFKYNHPLPTSDVLGLAVPSDCDASKEAEALIAQLSRVMEDSDPEAFAELFLEHGKRCRAH